MGLNYKIKLYGAIGVLVFAQFVVSAQQFAPDIPALLNQYPFFNSSVIKSKSIKKITTKVMYKSPNKKIVFSAEGAIFECSRNGNVTKWKRTNRSGIMSTTSYFLSKNGRLATEHFETSHTDELKSYVYNTEGFITEIIIADARTAKVIQEEKFKYEIFSELQYKKYWLNSEGLTYKYTVVDTDDEGRKEEERTRFIRGASRETIYYTYTNGWLTEYSYNMKTTTRRETKYVLEYAQNGDLLTMNESVDGAFVTRFEYLYEDGLLIAILQKNINSQQIKIIKVKYEFY